MTDVVKILVEPDPIRFLKLRIPERVMVPLNTLVTFQLISADLFKMGDRTFDMHLYFEGRTPFLWKSQAMTLEADFRFDFTKSVLASGVTNREGDYKYGIKIIEPRSGRIISDDDPYLTVRQKY